MIYTGEKVKYMRMQLDLSQVELAKKIGITNDKLSKREVGEHKFTLVEAYKISKIFNKSIESIFFKDELQKEQLEEVI